VRGERNFLAGVALVLAAVMAPALAEAQTTLSLGVGYAGSSGIDNAATEASAEVRSTAVWNLALGKVLDGTREGQLLFQQQSTTLDPGGGAPPFDLTIRHLHLGGTVYFEDTVGKGAYVVGGLGATQFSPSTAGLGSEIRPSISLGIGYSWPLVESIDLRAEVRGFFILVNSNGDFLCSGGCVVLLTSDLFSQVQATIGIVGRF
jgi:hypothetical protein